MFNLSYAMHASTSHTAKKRLSLEEMETQTVLELPDRQLMRLFRGITIGVQPLIRGGGGSYAATAPDFPRG